MKTILKKCAACGGGPVTLVARSGRTQRYRNMTLPLPSDLAIPECRRCGESFIGEADATAMDRALERTYQHELRRRAVGYLDSLAKALPQYRLEVLLGLSAGYLSKIRAKEFPSAPLVTELALLAAAPEDGIAQLQAFWAKTPPRPRATKTQARKARHDSGRATRRASTR